MKKQVLELAIFLNMFVSIVCSAESNISAPTNVRIIALQEGITLWRENRDVMLEKGENCLEFPEVPATIDNPSIILRSLTEPENFKVIETELVAPPKPVKSHVDEGILEYDQDSNRPSGKLLARIVTAKPGHHKCEIMYKVGGLHINSRYVAFLGPKSTMDLKGVTNINNGCGLAINNTTVYFPAEKTPSYETSVLRKSYPVSQSTSVTHCNLQLILTPVSIGSGKSKNFEFASLSKISFRKVNLYDGLPVSVQRPPTGIDDEFSIRSSSYSIQRVNEQTVKIIYELDTSAFKALEGELPITSVEIYGLENNRLIFEQGYLDYDKLYGRCRIITGPHPGLSGSRKQLAFKEVIAGQSCEETIQVTIRNDTSETQEVLIREYLKRSNKYKILKSSQDYQEVEPGLIEFRSSVKPKKSSRIEYTVQYEY